MDQAKINRLYDLLDQAQRELDRPGKRGGTK